MKKLAILEGQSLSTLEYTVIHEYSTNYMFGTLDYKENALSALLGSA